MFKNHNMLNNINVVLSHTSHPGNIGAAARAMKTMGISRLTLLNPKNFPSFEATVRASKADDILENATIASSLDEALADANIVVGTSARGRHLDVPLLTSRELVEKISTDHHQDNVALMFGTESSGLTNEEISRCNYHVYIPANPDYSSLNLASAVQLICYELRVKSLENSSSDIDNALIQQGAVQKMTAEQMEGYYQHLEQVLIAIGYHNPKHPKMLMSRLRRLYNRVQPDHSEMQILRGILTAIQKNL